MRYPALTTQASQELARRLLDDESVDVPGRAQWMGRGEEFDLDHADKCSQEILTELNVFRQGSDSRDLDRFEGRASARLHRSLAGIPPEVLDDPGFWRFLTFGYYWSFVLSHERSAFTSGDYGRYRQYIDGTNPAECVLLRMFLRAQIAEERGTFSARVT